MTMKVAKYLLTMVDAVLLINGQEHVISTSGQPVAIRLAADRGPLKADNQDLSFIAVELIDENGQVAPDSDMVIDFEVEGMGKLIATGSSDIKDLNGYYHPLRKTHQGRAIAVVKAGKRNGQLLLKARTASGLKAEHVIDVEYL